MTVTTIKSQYETPPYPPPTAVIKIVGLDPSLTGFGIAELIPAAATTMTILQTWRHSRLTGHPRLSWLLASLHALVRDSATLAVIEGMSYASKGSAGLDLAGLHWLVRQMLWDLSIPYVVIPPSTRAKWLTGLGNASKDACLAAAVKRFPGADVADNNQADALTLAAMGADHAGIPIATMPLDRYPVLTANNRKGQPAIAWPWPPGWAAQTAGR